MSENWRQSEICIVLNDKSQGSIAKHLSLPTGYSVTNLSLSLLMKEFFNRRTFGVTHGVDTVYFQPGLPSHELSRRDFQHVRLSRRDANWSQQLSQSLAIKTFIPSRRRGAQRTVARLPCVTAPHRLVFTVFNPSHALFCTLCSSGLATSTLYHLEKSRSRSQSLAAWRSG